jgi:hypothetical protein
MQATTVVCPLCSVVTKVDSAMSGASVHCEACRGTFLVGTTAIVGGTPPVPAPAAAMPWWVSDEAASAPLPPIRPVAPASTTETVKVVALQETAPAAPVPAGLHAPRVGKLVDSGVRIAKAKPAPLPIAACATPVGLAGGGLNPIVVLGLIVGGLVVLLGISGVVAALCFAPNDTDPSVAQATEPQERPAPPSRTELSTSATRKVALKDSTEAAKDPPNDAGKQKGQPADDPPKKINQPEQPAPQNPPKQDAVKAPPPEPAAKTVVTAVEQKKIDEAIDRGMKYLLQTQIPDGSWQGNGHVLGTTALPALTLLECGVSPKDARIAAAADFVRKHWAPNHKTYEIALAILFLDKLIERRQSERKPGDKKDDLLVTDKQTIQALALRLLAGQTANGGWDYDCPALSNAEATTMMANLLKNRPKMPPTAVDTGNGSGVQVPIDKGDKSLLPNGLDKSKSQELPNGVPNKNPPKGTSLLETVPDLRHVPLLAGPPTARTVVEPLGVASAQPPKKDFPKGMKFRGDRDDNSNTQFAMMALWAARRHDVPVETALLTVEQRFRVTQLPEGSWAYLFKDQRPKASMTCVGLIGIALGKGTATEIALRGSKSAGGKGSTPKKLPMDAVIRDGLRFLAANLEERKVESQVWPSGLSLYFMWSVERVAVLYDLPRIEGKDWYHWGSTILLDTQRLNGFWDTHSYAGANATIDTCFALLFLKRVNLVQDLTDLQLYMAVPETQAPLPKMP